ncbi:helix-turn-helix domain-containing protein [Halopiger djelfimassiliensis]|uniref:helix-turn-helix domain-containing protein n=1 Tax=Halopiger djelfimassiliensis TaxID=1293047 RepID=UPI000677C86A|nr:helix-turn-helix domain-containing protein [Halopiger djelfimassiliensis]
MTSSSSIAGRLLACCAAVIVVGAVGGAMLAGTAAASAPDSSDGATLSDSIGERGDARATLSGTADDLLGDDPDIGTVDESEREASDEPAEIDIDGGTGSDTDSIVDATDALAADELPDGPDEGSTDGSDAAESLETVPLENATDPVGIDPEPNETAALENATAAALENATDDIGATVTDLDDVTLPEGLPEYLVNGTTGTVEVGPVDAVGTAPEMTADGVDAGSEVRGDDSDASDASAAETATTDDEGGTDGAPQPLATETLLVGLLGAITASGAAAGSAGAGATGAGAAGATGLARGFLTRWLDAPGTPLRRLGSAIPWKLGPVFGYSRYDDSDPLENDRRRAVYETIRADPGCYLSQVRDRTDVSLSTVRHHVRVLEEEGLVTSVKVGGKRRYYLEDIEHAELEAALAEPAKRDVLEALADLGPARNGTLADALDRDPSTVSHHLSSLETDGLVVRERDGRAVVADLPPEVEAAVRGEASLEGGRESTLPSPADD